MFGLALFKLRKINGAHSARLKSQSSHFHRTFELALFASLTLIHEAELTEKVDGTITF